MKWCSIFVYIITTVSLRALSSTPLACTMRFRNVPLYYITRSRLSQLFPLLSSSWLKCESICLNSKELKLEGNKNKTLFVSYILIKTTTQLRASQHNYVPTRCVFRSTLRLRLQSPWTGEMVPDAVAVTV